MYPVKHEVLKNPYFNQAEFDDFTKQFAKDEANPKQFHVHLEPSLANGFQVNMCLAMTAQGVIAINGAAPWGRIESDLNYFINWAKGQKVLVFGRTTFDTVVNMDFWKDKPCIVLSNTKTYPEFENVIVVKNLIDIWDAARKLITDDGKKETLMLQGGKAHPSYPHRFSDGLGICGGASLYHYFMPYANELDITIMEFLNADEVGKNNPSRLSSVKGIRQFIHSEIHGHKILQLDTFPGRMDFEFLTQKDKGRFKNANNPEEYLYLDVTMHKAKLDIYQMPTTHIRHKNFETNEVGEKALLDFYSLKNVTGIVVFEGMDYTGKTTLLKNTMLAAQRFYSGDNETIQSTIDQFVETENYPHLVRVLRMLPYPTQKHKVHFMSIAFPERTPEIYELMENKDGRPSADVYRDIIKKHLEYFHRKVEEFRVENNVGEDDEIIVFTDRSHISSAVYQNVLIDDEKDNARTAFENTLTHWRKNALKSEIRLNDAPPISGIVYCYANLETRLERAQVRDADSNNFVSKSDQRTLKHHTLFDTLYTMAMNGLVYAWYEPPYVSVLTSCDYNGRTFALRNAVSPIADTSRSQYLELK